MADWKNIIIVLQIYQSALFALLSFILFFRDGNYSKKYLGMFMLVSALFSVYKVTHTTGLYHVFWYLFPIGIPLFLLFFPAFYFYIKSLIIREYYFERKEYRHLMAPVILFVFSLPYYFLSGDQQELFAIQGKGLFETQWMIVLKYVYYFFVYGYFNFQVVFYSMKIAKLYLIHKKNLESAFSYKNTIKLSWVIILTVMIVGLLILLDLSYFTGLNEHDTFHTTVNLLVLMIILFFAVFGILQKDIYEHHEKIAHDPVTDAGGALPAIENPDPVQVVPEIIPEVVCEINPTIEPCAEEDCCRVKKYAGSGLKDGQKTLLAKNLEKLMKDKIYLNGKLSIDDVAEKLNTNSKYLSQVINESHNQNFYTYINTYRIQEAQRLLRDRHHQRYSIQGIARLVGFSSKSSFNDAFRRITGMTPSEFMEKE